MKKLLLSLMLLVGVFAVTAKADIFSPIDAKVKVESQFQTSLDTGSILADATTIINYLGVKEGYAYVLSMDEFARVGSTDVTFKRPGMEGNFFRELENSAGVELRCFSDMALFCSAPGKQVLISNIVNTA